MSEPSHHSADQENVAPERLVNPFWPYDLDAEPAAPDDLRASRLPSWAQHARTEEALVAASGVALGPPVPGKDATMSATGDAPLWTVATGMNLDEGLAQLLSLLETSEVRLGAFTDEELAAVAPVERYPLARYPLVEMVDPQLRDALLGAALRSLLARELVEMGVEPGSFRAVGALGTALALRASPDWVVTVERVAEFDPARRVLYGIGAGDAALVLEEALSPLGHHVFTLRSLLGSAAALAAWLSVVPDGRIAGAGPDDAIRVASAERGATEAAKLPVQATAGAAGPDGKFAVTDWASSEARATREALNAALDQMMSIARVFALRGDQDGGYTSVEAVVADAGAGEQWLIVFAPDAEHGETMTAISTRRLPLEDFLVSVLRFDLAPLTAALA